MQLRSLILLAASCLMLTACGSDRPVYSGHEESTEGVPGFDSGKKLSPYVKLGQSYKVGDTWYVPHFQPDYDETGLASWYGPGFHGGATANGEKFDKHSMTAAHKTLPLPSIVKVTMVSTGKSAYVRINDRGPFVNDRLIDLSYGAAKEIGLLQKGVGKVRVQYMLAESQRFADLLAQGRSPDSIDVATEVLPYTQGTQYASNNTSDSSSWVQHLNPVASAEAHEPTAPAPVPTDKAVEPIATADLPAPQALQVIRADVQTPANQPVASPFDVMDQAQQGATASPAIAQAPPPQAAAPPPTAPPTLAAARASPLPQSPGPPSAQAEDEATSTSPNAMYVQLGSYSRQDNAVAMVNKVTDIGPARITIQPRGDAPLYRVRLGPYNDPEMADEVLDRVKSIGIADARFVRP